MVYFVLIWSHSVVSVVFQYYAESHGVIYVIDSTDERRLGESKIAFGTFSCIYMLLQFVLFLYSKLHFWCMCTPDLQLNERNCLLHIGLSDSLCRLKFVSMKCRWMRVRHVSTSDVKWVLLFQKRWSAARFWMVFLFLCWQTNKMWRYEVQHTWTCLLLINKHLTLRQLRKS